LCQCAGDRHTERGNRVVDVPLRSGLGILGVVARAVDTIFAAQALGPPQG
jgi:hypothetical protein